MGLLLLLLHTTNTFPGSGSTCAQGICLRVSQQTGLGQGLRLASSYRLLKTAPQHDERGKWIFQFESRIISAQGITLCSKRLIKWDAIDTAPRWSRISAGHVHWQLLALKNGYMASTYGKLILTDEAFLGAFDSWLLRWEDKCNRGTFLNHTCILRFSVNKTEPLNLHAALEEFFQKLWKDPEKSCFLFSR